MLHSYPGSIQWLGNVGVLCVCVWHSDLSLGDQLYDAIDHINHQIDIASSLSKQPEKKRLGEP